MILYNSNQNLKHLFYFKGESGGLIKKVEKNDRIKTTNALLSRKLVDPLLEVKNIIKDETTTSFNGQTTSIHSTGEDSNYMRLNDLKETGSSNILATPKFILRQINERRALNPNPIYSLNNEGNGYGIDRKKNKHSKLVNCSSVTNLAKQQFTQQLIASSSSLLNQSTSNSKLQQYNNGNLKSAQNNSFASKMNEEFFSSLASNSSLQAQQQINHSISNSPANLYSSAFIASNSNTSLKTQFEKIISKSAVGGLVNSASSPSFLATSNSLNNSRLKK